MKKTLFIAAAILALASCTKEISTPDPNLSEGVTVTIQASVEPETKTNIDSQGAVSWESSEQIAVATSDGNSVNFDIADASKGTFSHTFASTAPTLNYAVTPAAALAMADGTMTAMLDLPSSYSYVAGTTNAIMVGVPNGQDGDNFKFKFSHAAALLKVTYANVPVGTTGLSITTDKNIAGTVLVDIAEGISISNTEKDLNSKTITVNLASAVSEVNSEISFYVPVPTGEYESLQVGQFNADGPIANTVKTLNKTLTLERKDVFVLPTITLEALPLYRKVTQDSELREGGQYLIVYEGNDTHDAVAFDGSLAALDAASNGVDVTISSNTIVSSSTLDASSFTISVENGTVLSASGKYVGASSYGNSLDASENSDYNNAISIDTEGNAVIGVDFGASSIVTMRYNYASDQLRFRYYKSGQQPIALYVKDNTGTPYVVKSEAGIYYNETDTAPSITIGDSFTAPALQNPNTLDVTYSSSNTDVATVVADGDGEGTVSIVGAGVTTITATFAGNDTYKAGTASYTLTVAPALEIITVAQFLAKEVSTTAWYQLTGTVTDIDGTNGAKYGNFTLVDATGSVYVYGLTKTQQASNDQSFASIGLKEGDIVTINTLRSEHSGTAQAGGSIPAYYVSHVPAPEISVDPTTKTVLAAGTAFNVTVASNCDWTISGNGFTANPSAGTSGDTEVEITVPARTVAGDGTITVTVTADDNSSVTATVTITQHGTDYTAPTGWIETALADIEAGDVFVIVGNNGSNYAMSNDNGTSNAPSAVAVTVADGKITGTVAANIRWNLTVSSGNYTFYPNGDAAKWLYTNNSNDGVRVGTNANKVFTISTEGYLVNSGTSRFIGVYSSNDWRCYTSINSNITGQTFKFYKLFGEDPGSGTQPTKYAINLASVSGGTITAKVGDSAVTEAEEGAVVTLEATADANYAFESWSVTGATVANASSATTTFTMGTSPVTVNATFSSTGSGFGENVTIATATFDGNNATYTEGWSTSGTGTDRTDCIIIGSGENITSPEFDLSQYSSVTISIKARRYGTLSGSKATIDASFGGTSVGTTEASGTNATTSLTVITFTPTSTASTFVFTCTNATSAGSTHGAGINTIEITGIKK